MSMSHVRKIEIEGVRMRLKNSMRWSGVGVIQKLLNYLISSAAKLSRLVTRGGRCEELSLNTQVIDSV